MTAYIEASAGRAQLSSDFDSCPLCEDGGMHMLRCEKCGRTRTEADLALAEKERR